MIHGWRARRRQAGETIGARLRRLRVERGASQRDLSAPGITYAYISRIEAGARTPSMKALRMLAQKLGVTPEYLETGSELDASELRELRLAEQELRLRLDGEADAEAVRELLADAEAAADVAAATRARIVLGLEAAARGDHAGTIAQLSEVVGSELVTPASRPDVYSTLGRAYAAAGSPREAVALFERALDELARVEPENMHARVRYSTYLSYALTDLGELQRAKAVVGELFAGAGDGADRYTRVRLLLVARAALARAGEAARRARQLPPGGRAARGDRGHRAPRAGPRRVRRRDDQRRRRPRRRRSTTSTRPSGCSARTPAADDLAAIRRLQAMCATAAGDWNGAEHLASARSSARRGPAERARQRLVGDRGGPRRGRRRRRRGRGLPRGARRCSASTAPCASIPPRLRSYGRFLRDSGREREALDVFERAAEVASNLQGEPTPPAV